MIKFVEDAGGIVTRDEFHISCGSYFISQEVHVLLFIPQEVLKDLKVFAKELYGDIKYLKVDKEQKLMLSPLFQFIIF